ncbi:MAG: hypothetical protein ACHQTF_06690 [Gemmatimonadales bacterium]
MRTSFIVSVALIAGFAATAGAQGSIKLADVTGKWSLKASPANDTVVVTSVVNATANSKTWTLTYPNREPIPMRVVASGGDSIVTEVGPYPSMLRKGQTVTLLRSVGHYKGDTMTGWFEAHYSFGDVIKGKQEGTRSK